MHIDIIKGVLSSRNRPLSSYMWKKNSFAALRGSMPLLLLLDSRPWHCRRVVDGSSEAPRPHAVRGGLQFAFF